LVTVGFVHIRALFALFAAAILAVSSLAAPAAEAAEELEHIAFHTAHGPDHAGDGADLSGVPATGPQHPETPGDAHCGPSCHLQAPDERLEIAAIGSAASADFPDKLDSTRPSGHLDGLFRPPRA
jgi:hypothetical protein